MYLETFKLHYEGYQQYVTVVINVAISMNGEQHYVHGKCRANLVIFETMIMMKVKLQSLLI